MSFLNLAQLVAQGETRAIPAYIQLKEAEEEIKIALEIVQPLAISEADTYPEKTIKFANAIIEKRSAPATWDYSQCIAYQQAKERLKYIEKIAQAGGGATQEGEYIDRAFRIEGRAGIAVKLLKA